MKRVLMRRGSMRRGFWAVALMAAATVTAGAAEKLSVLRFVVQKEATGKPVRNASVVLHPINKKGLQARSGVQLKTDAEGKTEYDGVPYGKLRIQVLAHGFQTFGEDYEVTGPAMEIVIKMKRPTEQYTIYGDTPPEEKKQ
jgi:hypothetical protein